MKKMYFISETKLEHIIQRRIEEAFTSAAHDYERELLMKQANISMLQGQINPHFLYNALECIRGQALLENCSDIADAAQALSLFFRYSISSPNDFVTLSEELGNVKNYVTIQQYRFKNRFTLEIQTDSGDISNALVPKLLLQPIVENSILHGFENQTEGGRITLSVFCSKYHLRILISDNGQGMDTETLALLTEQINHPDTRLTPDSTRRFGIALANVNKRIQLFFGPEYGLSICSCPGNGTDVEIIVPVRYSSGNAGTGPAKPYKI